MSVRNTRGYLLFVLLNSYIWTVLPCFMSSNVVAYCKSCLTCISFLNCDCNIVKLYKTNVWSIFASFCFFWPGEWGGGGGGKGGLNGYVRLNKVWFLGSWVLNRVTQLDHLASMSSRTGCLSALEALDNWSTRCKSYRCHLVYVSTYWGIALEGFWRNFEWF